MRCALLAATLAAGLMVLPARALASFTDFGTWTQVQDPPNANMSGSVDTSSQITLIASGAVPNAVDIGYQSVNANTPATSSAGFAFDPTASFSLAVDYNLSFVNAVGGIAIGFGIGEDGAGVNSAGVVIGASNGLVLGASGAARANNSPSDIQPVSLLPPASGSLHVAYDAATGNIVVGTAGVGANAPTASATLIASLTYDVWNADADDDLLLASLFLRSDDTLGTAFTSGTATAVFSNVRITSGSAVSVPEPGSMALLALAGLVMRRRR